MKYVRIVPLATLFLVMVYFAIFNWSVFIVSLDISTGFGLVTLPLVAAVFLVGLVFLGLQTGLTYFIDLRRSREKTQRESEIGTFKKEKDLEISALKASFYEEEAGQIKQNAERIAELQMEMEKVREWMHREGVPLEDAEPRPEEEKPDGE
jgi:hypothetical protein